MIVLALLARVLLGAIFLMSAFAKLAAPRSFARDVRGYHFLPGPLADAFGYALPFTELTAAALLLSGLYPQWGAGASIAMLLAFMVAVGWAMARNLNLSCSCFGLLYRERVGWQTQIRDGILLAMALVVFVGDDGTKTVAYLASNLHAPTYALALVATIAATGFASVVGFLSIRYAWRERLRAREEFVAMGQDYEHPDDSHEHAAHEHDHDQSHAPPGATSPVPEGE